MKDFAPIITVNATPKNHVPLFGWLYLLFIVLFSFWAITFTPTIAHTFIAYFLSIAGILCIGTMAASVAATTRTNKRR